MRKGLLSLCRQVRPQAVLLTDALAIPDFVLKAPFGCYDGDIYRKYFEVLVFISSTFHARSTDTAVAARQVVRNAPQTNENGRPFYYEESVAPLIRGTSQGMSKL